MTVPARLSVKEDEGRTVLVLAGRLDAEGAGALWRQAMRAAAHAPGRTLAFDLGAVSFCDVGGATFLAALEAAHGEAAELIGADERVVALLRRARSVGVGSAGSQPVPWPTMRDVVAAGLELVAASIAFLG